MFLCVVCKPNRGREIIIIGSVAQTSGSSIKWYAKRVHLFPIFFEYLFKWRYARNVCDVGAVVRDDPRQDSVAKCCLSCGDVVHCKKNSKRIDDRGNEMLEVILLFLCKAYSSIL